ncbi:hypothetical protein DQ244_00095 [Blastococcus sp. TBT05-19]|uniref:hypothetical protein n=1 Tax=Blastococcus sp. TBT05-19 TaxID=2250581 RepID=UPI000DE8DAA8|nr:hypothetical protein [Blastococcus sp. TBT05-19]RBY93830.1 hypothetical protein DQ244_00095 [Blastococcus sp. TBT05-19]
MSDSPPRRVRVTSPRTVATRAQRVPAAREIDAQTMLGEVYMSSLLRSQLRLALLALAAVGVLVGGIPLVFWLFPDLTSVEVLAVPLPWLLLAFAVYPFLFGIGWLYVRAAERNERDFADVLERS